MQPLKPRYSSAARPETPHKSWLSQATDTLVLRGAQSTESKQGRVQGATIWEIKKLELCSVCSRYVQSCQSRLALNHRSQGLNTLQCLFCSIFTIYLSTIESILILSDLSASCCEMCITYVEVFTKGGRRLVSKRTVSIHSVSFWCCSLQSKASCVSEQLEMFILKNVYCWKQNSQHATAVHHTAGSDHASPCSSGEFSVRSASTVRHNFRSLL